MLPLLLRPSPRGPGRRHPAGEWGRGRVGEQEGEAAARGRAARPGQSRSRRPFRRGAGRERRSLEPGCRGGSAASARASAALHGARRPLASALSCCCSRRHRRRRRRRRKSEARGSRHEETAAGTGADWAAAPRQLRTAPSALFKGTAHAPPPPRRAALRAPPRLRAETAAAGEGQWGRRLGFQAAGFRRGRRVRAAARRGRTGLQNASEGTEQRPLPPCL